MSKQIPIETIKKIESYRKSPFVFINDMWGLTPQKIKKEKQERFNIYFADRRYDEITEDFFEPFIEGQNITWQQVLIIKSVENAVNKEGRKRISVRSGHGVGKVQNNSLIINTPSGKRKWGEIKVGDYLFGADGEKTKVLKKFIHTDWDFYKITFDDKTFTYCGKEHLWNVRGRQERRKGLSGWRTLSLEEIMEKGVKRSNGKVKTRQWEIPITEPVKYKEIKTDINPYLFGAYLGDGTKTKNSFCSGNKDWEHWINVWSKEYKIGSSVKGEYITLLEFRKTYRKYCNKRTNELFIHEDYKYNSVENRIALLQGLLDTDGNAGSNSRAEFCSISERLVDDVIWLARSLGLKAMKGKNKKPYYYKNDKKIYGQIAYRCNITYNGRIDLFRLDRKQRKLTINEPRYTTRWIDKIEYSHKEDGHCVQVERSLYLTNDFIVTHNTTTFSWILLWYLFCFLKSQIAATAPSQTQMYDALWKEVYKQLKKMPPAVQKEYDWQSSYIRMVSSPQDWFARARTARKEAPEALAGLHGDNVLILADEASAVHEAIFNTIEGALTEENILVLMISNPTRNVGYFYESQLGDDMDAWERFKFSTTNCPRVSDGYENRIISKHGKDSDEYRIRVLGEFPDVEQVDEEGYSPLFLKDDVKEIDAPKLVGNTIWVGTPIMGLDPAGEGNDETVWVIRDSFKAKIVLTKKISDEKQIAAQTATLMGIHGVKDENIYIDSFGIGHKCALELTRAGFYINAINVGDSFGRDTEEYNLYINIRAKNYYCLRNWARAGAEFIRNPKWQVETPSIKYRRQAAEKSRIQIMSKIKMKKLGYKSPDNLDALAITFTEDDGSPQQKIVTITKSQMAKKMNKNNNEFDPFATI